MRGRAIVAVLLACVGGHLLSVEGALAASAICMFLAGAIAASCKEDPR